MSAITFDSLEFVKTIESSGVERKQAEAFAKAVSTIRLDADAFASKEEFQKHEREITNIHHEITIIQKDIADIKNNMATKADLKDMQIKTGAMIMALGGFLVAIKYLG